MGKPQAMVRGHTYIFDKKSKSDPSVDFYKCSNKRCSGRIWVRGNKVVDFKQDHQHDPEVQELLVKVKKAREDMKAEGSTVGADRSEIMSHYYDELDDNTKALLPERKSVYRMVYNKRPGSKKPKDTPKDDVPVKDLGNLKLYSNAKV